MQSATGLVGKESENNRAEPDEQGGAKGKPESQAAVVTEFRMLVRREGPLSDVVITEYFEGDEDPEDELRENDDFPATSKLDVLAVNRPLYLGFFPILIFYHFARDCIV